MIKSMTGFGKAAMRDGEKSVSVEIKCVNHRFLDLSCKMGRPNAYIEDKTKKLISERLARGKVDLSGDSSKYSVEKKEKLEKAACILYGGRYGYSKAIAAKSGYSYSVRANFAMTKSDMEDIIKVMVK